MLTIHSNRSHGVLSQMLLIESVEMFPGRINIAPASLQRPRGRAFVLHFVSPGHLE